MDHIRVLSSVQSPIPMAPAANESREDLICKAKLAEKAQRYDDMVKFMEKIVVTCSGNLTIEERNFFAASFKSVIGTRRMAWRIVSSIGKKDESEGKEQQSEIARDYMTEIEIELTEICERILKVLDHKLIPAAKDAESKVSYLKLKGDYCRYMAEYMVGPERKDAAENTLKAYKAAQDIATKELPQASHIRLGLALNFSVFYYEILNSSDKACALAKEAFDAAVSEMESAEGDESFKDSSMIVQLLRDNLKLWTGEDEDEIMEPSE